MNVELLSKVATRTAAEVCRLAGLSDEAGAPPADGQAPGPYLGLLVDQGLDPDAIRFLAHALPKREAVWWACQCVRQTTDGAAPPALEAAERWVAEPTEENRRAAGLAAEAAGVGTPAGCAAMAAFWSGGSLGPAHLPEIPPGDDLTGRGAAGAALLAAVMTEPEKAPERFRRFLELGLEVAGGTLRWTTPSAAPPTTPGPAPRRPSSSARVFDSWE